MSRELYADRDFKRSVCRYVKRQSSTLDSSLKRRSDIPRARTPVRDLKHSREVNIPRIAVFVRIQKKGADFTQRSSTTGVCGVDDSVLIQIYETLKIRGRDLSLVWSESGPLRGGLRYRADSVITDLMRGIAGNGGSEEVAVVDLGFKLPQRSAFELFPLHAFPTPSSNHGHTIRMKTSRTPSPLLSGGTHLSILRFPQQ